MHPRFETTLHLATVIGGAVIPALTDAGVSPVLLKILGAIIAAVGAFNLSEHGKDQLRAAGSIVVPSPEVK